MLNGMLISMKRLRRIEKYMFITRAVHIKVHDDAPFCTPVFSPEHDEFTIFHQPSMYINAFIPLSVQ